ncbi:hypothetical protein MLD38_029953 [Melastoma candidum]|uniref:Uncharacterized protein n=1 Tax=Melastoma candidum TaxID=119954 RepID=A0ACB9MKU5_9MYRT|nr:hypothetical protein MLD38_029953 [Melastoma candidum]
MASFVDDDSPVAVGDSGDSTRPFDDGYDPRLPSQHFEYSPGYDADSPPVFNAHQSFGSGHEVLVGSGGFSPEHNGEYFRASEGPMLPHPSEMQTEEGFALREWRRLNAIKLEEKEKREKEVLVQIIEEAEQFKVEFYQKRAVTVENNRNSNREKEKLFLASREKFHSEAEKNYWKAIGELIPHEVPTIEKRGKKDKDKEKKPSIVVIQGPKPGKPSDLSRMRQILLKLKHNTPEHMKPKPPPATEPKKDAKPGEPATGSPTPPPPSAAKEVSASA